MTAQLPAVLENTFGERKVEHSLIMDIIRWDTVNWSQCLSRWQEEVTSENSLECLEIGAREGGLSLWAALHGNHAVCSDLENPEAVAKPLHQKYEVTDRISYEAINIFDIPYENHFDLIFLKSILATLGRLGRQAQLDGIRALHRALKPGGKLLFAENLVASPLHTFARERFVDWGAAVRYIDLSELDLLLEDFTSIDYETSGFFGVFGRTEPQRRLLGHIDQVIYKLLPRRWHYLAIGEATK